MANDGGLRHVLQTSERVSNNLFALSSNHQPTTNIDLNQNNVTTTAASSSSSGGAKNKRKPSRSLSEISGNTDHSIRMDLSQHTSDELKRVVMPLVRSLEKLDAAALLSLNPSPNNNGSKGTKTSGNGNSSTSSTTDSNLIGATLDPSRNLTVTPIHDRITPRYNEETSSNPDNIVRYLHVREVPQKYSIGIFIFPPNAEIPLHDHPDMVVLSRVLYGEFAVRSYDVLPTATTTRETQKNNDGGGMIGGGITHQKDNNSDHNIEKTRIIATSSSQSSSSSSSRSSSSKHSALRSSLHKIKNFVSRALSYNDMEGAAEASDDDVNMQMQADSVLRVKPNLKPMGVQQTLPRDDSNINNHDNSNNTNLHRPSILSAPSVTCLYPHEGNCHAFVAGPQGAAMLDVLLPPYDSDDDRDCTFYEPRENNRDHTTNAASSAAMVKKHKTEDLDHQVSCTTLLTPIDQPDDFHCLSGVYGRFGSCDENPDGDDDVGGVVEGDHDGSGMSTTPCNLY